MKQAVLICFSLLVTAGSLSGASVQPLSNQSRLASTLPSQSLTMGQARAFGTDDEDDDDDAPPPPRKKHHRRVEEGGDGDEEGLPSGSQLSRCGCWGYVAPGAGRRNSQCASGYEVAESCGGVCPMGGLAWARVCR